MSIDDLLDRLLVPRSNGTAGLCKVETFIREHLIACGARVTLHAFRATPRGFQLVWMVALLLALGFLAAVIADRHGVALLLALAWPVLLLAEFESLRSPVSGLLSATEHNVIGTFGGRDRGPRLILCAHYDTATHFGDHFTWYRWGLALGPTTLLAMVIAAWGLLRSCPGSGPRYLVECLAAAAVPVPFGAMAYFQALGPLVRRPSPGALDNGGAVAVLLQLAALLTERPPDAPLRVDLVFTAAEEERALGSWAFAKSICPADAGAVVNLESVGACPDLAYVPEDGFQLRRYRSPGWLVRLLKATAQDALGIPLPPKPLPRGTFTDGRSFLAHGIAAVTLRSGGADVFPRRLHSAHDSRERLSVAGLYRCVRLLAALVDRLDREPEALARTRRERT